MSRRLSLKIARLVLWSTLSLQLGAGLGASAPALHAEDGAPPGEGDPAPPDASKEELEKRLRELEQRLAILERQKEVEQEIAAQKAKETGAVSAGQDGFVIKSADGAYQLKIRALVQADGRFWDGQETRPVTDTFDLRRARPILEGTVNKFFDFRLVPDFGEGKTTLFDAYIDWRFAPWIRLRAGKFKPPVGLERLQSASDTDFVERALPTNLVPNRDVGLQLGGDVLEGVVSYAAGVFNGVPDGANVDLDTNDNKETEARVFLQPFKTASVPSLQNLGFGVAVTDGNNFGTLSATGLPSYKTPGQQTFFSYRTNTPATLAGTGSYQFVKYAAADRIELKKNDKYWGADPSQSRPPPEQLKVPPSVTPGLLVRLAVRRARRVRRGVPGGRDRHEPREPQEHRLAGDRVVRPDRRSSGLPGVHSQAGVRSAGPWLGCPRAGPARRGTQDR